MKDKFTPARQGDYTSFCQICGQKCWSSEIRKQDTYTGRGGTLACKECQDPIDYGLVPYKVPAERPVPFTTGVPFNTFGIGKPFIAEDFDWTNTPQYIESAYSTWDQLVFSTWDQWTFRWDLEV